MSFTALALVIGLGARILLDQFTRSGTSSFRDFIVLGLWQGCGLYYVTATNKDLVVPVAALIAAKLCIEFVLGQDTVRAVVTALGIALGYCGTDLLSSSIDSQFGQKTRKRHHHIHRPRSIHAHRSEGDERRSPRRDGLRRAVSDITSVDTNSLLFSPNPTMTPLDREVAALRARASLADSERRRYKEERKWAIEQGNGARAKEMSWQVKRYSALMKSFHREADDKIIEASTRRQPHATPEPYTRNSDATDPRSGGIADRRHSMRVNVR
ncbi:hypothetical protein B0H10DRAFT_610105 [Mycena sp. CBHHK59/15]|nr:hypothetical protein B0H10DRAFT_610105 [Mycena sp. CBHHK59/15]